MASHHASAIVRLLQEAAVEDDVVTSVLTAQQAILARRERGQVQR